MDLFARQSQCAAGWLADWRLTGRQAVSLWSRAACSPPRARWEGGIFLTPASSSSSRATPSYTHHTPLLRHTKGPFLPAPCHCGRRLNRVTMGRVAASGGSHPARLLGVTGRQKGTLLLESVSLSFLAGWLWPALIGCRSWCHGQLQAGQGV